ncbi:helix-turn-helix domain-containing protein [Patescibacteria group bacterium]|nr:helix-turn-helix domain-containing protein [Patescibacteria group bacterium]MBU2036196.1 helix-turn-helix domain-containing protein [Patescibacteria group bacterium]
MNTIGEILKKERLSKKYSLQRIEELTKIKKEFVDNIENCRWNKLPEYSTVLGFVKSLSQYLEIDGRKAVAVLKRDYSPKKQNQMNPKPDISNKFNWSPKLTFWFGFIFTFLLVISYLLFQYKKFVSPPNLVVNLPEDNQTILQNKVKVLGKTDSDAVITVNNQPVLTSSDGDFEVKLQITSETNEIIIKAVSRSGKETVIRRNIKPEF